MTDGVFREIAVTVRRAGRKQIRAATRGVLDDGGRLIAGRGNLAGVWQPGDGGTGHDQGAEPPLGVPAVSGQVLASDTAGVRSWVAAGATVLDDLADVDLSTPPTDGEVLTWSAGASAWVAADYVAVLLPIIDGGGVAITTGLKIEGLEFPWAGTIEQVSLYADVSGSVVLDFWKDSYANFPPTIADTITASAKPTLSSARKSRDSTLTGWTKTFAAGDSLSINVDSVSTITKLTIAIKIRRTA